MRVIKIAKFMMKFSIVLLIAMWFIQLFDLPVSHDNYAVIRGVFIYATFLAIICYLIPAFAIYEQLLKGYEDFKQEQQNND